jgi:hypothetical protein
MHSVAHRFCPAHDEEGQRKMPAPTFHEEADAVSRPAGSPKFARSRQMVECLRKDMLYSEKRPRDLLFSSIERLIDERPPMMMSQLCRESALHARRLSADAGFEFENWEPVSKAVMKTLLMAGALLGPSGDTIAFDIAAQASTVGALRAGHRDLAEAFLLEFLIRQLGDVTTRDHTALAHALFRQFDPSIRREDFEDRVVILLARLSDRVVLSGNAYRLSERTQS